jgi:Family of unknown function (DUF6152)
MKPLVVAAAFAATCIAIPASAHHSLAAYSNEKIELEGEIARIGWANPHVILELETTGNDGKQTWRMEGGSVTTLQRAGVTRDLVRVGDRVRIAGLPSRREPFMLVATNVLLPDGRELRLLTGAPPHFTGPDGLVRGAERTVDAQRENLGLFRVWSVPIPNPAGAAALRNLPFTPQAVAARASFDPLDNFAIRCEPEGMPRIMFNPHPFELVDRGETILLRAELYDTERVIHMGRTAAPADEPHSRLGYSIGRWERGSLVVTTTHVDWPFFDNAGTPQSTAVEIVERYSLSEEQARLSFRVTVTDPATFTTPAVIDSHWLALGHTVDRYDCQRSAAHETTENQ